MYFTHVIEIFITKPFLKQIFTFGPLKISKNAKTNITNKANNENKPM